MTVKEKSIGTEKRIFRVPFNETQLAQLKENFTTESVMISKLQDDIDLIRQEYKEKIEPHKNKAIELLSQIRQGYFETEKEVYLIPDYENDSIKIMTEEGELLDERKMTPEERQLNLNIN